MASRKVKKRNSLRTQRNENVKLMIENGKWKILKKWDGWDGWDN